MFDLAIQWALKSLLQHHNWKASVLQHSAFFMVRLSQAREIFKDISVGMRDHLCVCVCERDREKMMEQKKRDLLL